jgi:hypothetical protein
MTNQELNPEQRAELERLGRERVNLILASWAGGHTGPGSTIGGFTCGDITRGVIDSWLAEKLAERKAQEKGDRCWLRVAAIAAIVAAILTAVSVVIAWLQAAPSH